MTHEPYDSRSDTEAHIRRVQELVGQASNDLRIRGALHDASKLQEPEKSMFDAYTPKLRAMTYGSDEYKQCLAEMRQTALAHHYEHNSHHPEHWPNGINDMSLLDMIEMLADWKAAGERHTDGSMAKSLEINRERFGISEQLFLVLLNTVQELGW